MNEKKKWWDRLRKKEETPADEMNRATFRQSGLHGRKHSQLVPVRKGIKNLNEQIDPRWAGMPVAGFLGAQGRPRVWFPHFMSRGFRYSLILKELRFQRESAKVVAQVAKEEESDGN